MQHVEIESRIPYSKNGVSKMDIIVEFIKNNYKWMYIILIIIFLIGIANYIFYFKTKNRSAADIELNFAMGVSFTGISFGLWFLITLLLQQST